jgi:hypothetical protein
MMKKTVVKKQKPVRIVRPRGFELMKPDRRPKTRMYDGSR